VRRAAEGSSDAIPGDVIVVVVCCLAVLDDDHARTDNRDELTGHDRAVIDDCHVVISGCRAVAGIRNASGLSRGGRGEARAASGVDHADRG
jgi:hypothetical protein